jgi:putative phosphoribosyl transferase
LKTARLLAERLRDPLAVASRADGPPPVIVAVHPGSVALARRLAAVTGLPIEVVFVRKLVSANHPSRPFGALGEEGVRLVDHARLEAWRITGSELAAIESIEREEVRRRARQLRRRHPQIPLGGRTVIVVVRSSSELTAASACRIARRRGAAHVILAMPDPKPGWIARLAGVADDYVTAARAQAVG